jgi:3-methyl-2-oxobutanoate hydroxymethyltransferase
MSTEKAPAGEAITAAALRARKGGDKLVFLTAYDVTFARLADRAGVDAVLVGDSLGMVFQGHGNTLPVTLDEMIYHARAVVRGVSRAHVLVDLPFMSYQASAEDALRAGGRVLKESGAQSVKLEGGEELAPTVARMVAAGIPVMGHVGLTPQAIHQLGGYRVQGRSQEGKDRILAGARALVDAGIYALLVEGMPAPAAGELTAAIPVPTVGIGAGPGCDGQVLVMHDLLGLDPGWSPRFVRRYAQLGADIERAFSAYAADVRAGRFPGDAESYK